MKTNQREFVRASFLEFVARHPDQMFWTLAIRFCNENPSCKVPPDQLANYAIDRSLHPACMLQAA